MAKKQNIFEVATRSKARFPYLGSISTEDLWDLSVENLDGIFKSLNSQLRRANEESLLDKQTKEDRELALRIEVVKHVVTVKQEETATRLLAKERREQKQKIMAIMASKQDAALEGKTMEELEEMLDRLG